MIGRLGADLALIQSVVGRSNVLYDKTPLVRSLIEVDADTWVADEGKQTDGQRVDVVITTPRDLQHVT